MKTTSKHDTSYKDKTVPSFLKLVDGHGQETILSNNPSDISTWSVRSLELPLVGDEDSELDTIVEINLSIKDQAAFFYQGTQMFNKIESLIWKILPTIGDSKALTFRCAVQIDGEICIDEVIAIPGGPKSAIEMQIWNNFFSRLTSPNYVKGGSKHG